MRSTDLTSFKKCKCLRVRYRVYLWYTRPRNTSEDDKIQDYNVVLELNSKQWKRSKQMGSLSEELGSVFVILCSWRGQLASLGVVSFSSLQNDGLSGKIYKDTSNFKNYAH